MTRTRSVIQGFRRTFGLATLLTVGASSFAHAQVPPAERAVLMALYESTNGDAWTDNTGWNGPVGTECSWFGIWCGFDEVHVLDVALNGNNLIGSLPALADLTNLERLWVDENQLSGSIPSLAGLKNLVWVDVRDNQLSGSIPPLTGLASLFAFHVSNNQLSGPLPSLAGHKMLQNFGAYGNQLSGPIPTLSSLSSLEYFSVGSNQLSGPIPSLEGLTRLEVFNAYTNELSGGVPSLSGLTNLVQLNVMGNRLSGDMPDVPDPNALVNGVSRLCPNAFNPIDNAAWDAATGATPWHQLCEPLPDPVYVNGFDLP